MSQTIASDIFQRPSLRVHAADNVHVAPVLKVASNSEMAQRLADIIDFDAGPIIHGEAQIAELADELLQMCIDTASGRYRPKAVGLAQYDFIPWKRGVSL